MEPAGRVFTASVVKNAGTSGDRSTAYGRGISGRIQAVVRATAVSGPAVPSWAGRRSRTRASMSPAIRAVPRENLFGRAESKTGRPETRFQGSRRPVSTLLTSSVPPSDRTARTAPVSPAIRNRRSRKPRTVADTHTISRGQPKKFMYSGGPPGNAAARAVCGGVASSWRPEGTYRPVRSLLKKFARNGLPWARNDPRN